MLNPERQKCSGFTYFGLALDARQRKELHPPPELFPPNDRAYLAQS